MILLINTLASLKVAVDLFGKVPERFFKVEPLKDITLTAILKPPNMYRHYDRVLKLF